VASGPASSSVTKFWTGFQILEKRVGPLVDQFLSPEQFRKNEDVEHEVIQEFDLIPLKTSNGFGFTQNVLIFFLKHGVNRLPLTLSYFRRKGDDL